MARAQHRVLAEAVIDRFSPGRQAEFSRVGVVAVEHGEARRRTAGALEQALLGGEIRFHGAVKIQVVAGQVGEDRGVEGQAVHASQLQRVRRDFHGDVGPAFRFQFGEQPHQVERFRSGIGRRQDTAGQVILDGPDKRRGGAGGAQHGVDQVAGGRLPVSPGDAGQLEAFVGTAVEIARGQGERAPAVLHLEPGAVKPVGGRRFADDDDSAARPGIGGEAAAVDPASREREKRIAGLNPPGIVLETGDLQARELLPERLHQSGARE